MIEISNDRKLLTRIVEDYSDMSLRIAYQYTKNHADAEDIVQEVFLKLMKEREFQSEEHLKAWIIRVTINQCKDLRKSFWKRNMEEIDTNYPVKDLEKDEIKKELMKLASLERTILYLFYYEGYHIHEIAKMMNMNENTLASKLRRARNRWKEILKEEGYYEEQVL